MDFQTAQVDTEKEGNGIKFEDPSKYYEYLCLLGKGEYGQVFKVMDRRDVFSNNEVNFMQDINHRNITNLIEVYYWHEQLYVFMELCGGGSLFGLCYKTGPFNEQEIAYITKQCLQGLHYIHGKGYMHRDLKIENILLTETETAKESQPNSFEKNNVSHKTETKKRTLQRIKKVWKRIKKVLLHERQ
uniref:Protein kinase domain-containing protein n=1 Tax=Denticeps clupeoides TaxID=299321 RepID=A0AAY4DPI7_9TELE